MTTGMCIGLVLYNPDQSIIDFIDSISCTGVPTYIFDNSPSSRFQQLQTININYETAGQNLGLGHGLVSICKRAYNDGMESLIFFDQDTNFTNNTINFIKNFTSENLHLKKDYSSITFNNKGKQPSNQDVILAINSGTLFFLENLRKIGWHNPSFFVDCVDYEYCFRARQSRFKLMECSCAPEFDHLQSQDADLIGLFGKKFSLFRRYSRQRIIGTMRGSARLIVLSIRSKDIAFASLVARFIIIYIIFQIVAYSLSFFRIKE